MSLKFSSFLFLITILVGCGGEYVKPIPSELPSIYFTYDDNFPVEYKKGVEAALDEWQILLQDMFQLKFVSQEKYPNAIAFHIATGAEAKEMGIDPSKTLAFVQGKGCWFLPGTIRTYTKYIKQIAIHEFGHIFGAPHKKGTIMNPEILLTNDCVDLPTANAVAAFRKWDLDKMYFCNVLTGLEEDVSNGHPIGLGMQL